VDIEWIATLANVTVEQAENELAGKILWTPDGRWETADQYLSGNILEKLNAAKAMLGVEPRLKATVEALVGAMPKPLKAGQIKARLGSGWIPAQYIEQFIADILPGVNAQVTHLPQLGAWKLSVRNKWYVPAENTTRWGTERKGALELIEIGLNAGTPVVHDEIEEKRVLNRDATLAAQAKLEELKARFETWLWQDSERAEHLAQVYNTRFNVFTRPRHDGSHLTFPGLSKFVTPRPLQKDAVWFALQAQAALVGDEVGLGKTLTAILSIKEATRLGTAHKALIVVPNHLTEQWRDAFLLAYPNAHILCAGKDDFKKNKRGEFLSRIATGRWDAVIVPQSSFKLLPVSPDVLNRFIEEELDELQTFLQELKAEDGYDRRAEKEIVKAIKRFEAKLVTKSEMDKDSLETITWERLGVDLLVSDEFHQYKNLYFHTKMTRIAGLPNADSQRAFDMFIKVRNLLENGGRFIGLTGTPITNTMAEAFTMQRYFQYDTLRDLGLVHFDSWAQMFTDTVMLPEMTPDGGGFRVNTRLARFTNIPELAAMLSQFMIMRRWQQVSEEVERPSLYSGKPVTVSLPGSSQLKEFVKELAERAEAVRGGHVDPRVDNMLRITGEGRKAALDMRLLFPGAPDLGSSKINTAAWVISQIYHRTNAFKSAQLVFCDLGTPKPHKDSVILKGNDEDGDSPVLEEEPGFDNVYADLKAKLTGHGVLPDEIAFIHDAKNPTARSLLFEAVREGRIRILIGSTEKMGTGMNVQARAVAMHHLDAPWRPADLEQREGRLLRQGNLYSEVFSFVYITEGSFDGFIWQILETKARFIAQFLMGQTDTREIDDVNETVLSMAEIKALASGNPKIIERVMVQNELLKLEHLRASWQSNRRDSQRRLLMSEKELEQVSTRVGYLRKAAEVRDSHPGEKFAMTVTGSTHTERRLAGQALIEAARDLKLEADRKGQETKKQAGTYRGFTLWLRTRPASERSMYELVRVDEGGVDILLDYGVPQVLAAHVSESETGTVMSIDAVIRSIDGEIGKNVERQEYLSRQIQTFKAVLSEEWEHAEKLGNLTGRLAVLDRELLEAGVSLPDSTATTAENSEGESIEVVRTEAFVEESNEAESTKFEFDLDAILLCMDELHAAMPAYEEPVVSVPSPAQEAIPITPEVVSMFEREAQAAKAMADLGRSLLSGQQMSLEAWLGAHPVDPAIKKKSTNKRKKEISQHETAQLTLF
jgi:N12 class adenine-specific DNA methylase